MNYSPQFEIIFPRIVDTEGGYSKDPNDPGNYGIRNGQRVLIGTKYGVSGASYPNLDIPNITLEDAKGIFYKDFYLKVNGDQFPLALSMQMCDAEINHGWFGAIKMLQFAASVTVDGVFGPLSLAAVNRIDKNDILYLFLARRIDVMVSDPNWLKYGAGWMHRISKNLRYCAQDNINLASGS